MSVKAMKWAYGLLEVVDVPPVERLILLALCWDHTDANGCYPSQDRIALLSGYRRRRVVDGLAKLEAMGLISRKTSRTKGKFQKTSYQLFGAPRVKPCADGGTRSRAHKKAHGDRAQTGAQYRGTNTNRDGECENVVDFPFQMIGNGGSHV